MNTHKIKIAALVAAFSISLLSCKRGSETPSVLEEGEEMSGGTNTIFDVTENAFGHENPSLTSEERDFFFVGNSLFKQNWVMAPSSTTARDGLGPLFNARSCSSCHLKDGKGRPPEFYEEKDMGLLLRLSITGKEFDGSPTPHPIYGGQLQDNAVSGYTPEGEMKLVYTIISGKYADGTIYELQKPLYSIGDPNYGDPGNVEISPRVGSTLSGLGLLEAITEETLLAWADEMDSDNDGISGKVNYVWDQSAKQKTIGRFGWKANQPNLKQQVAGAFLGDMGITSSLNPNENCNGSCEGNTTIDLQISDENLKKVVSYCQTLAVPGRRDWKNNDVLNGKALFQKMNCDACHKPSVTTGNHAITSLSNQKIRPYTDLLLHDMGDDLADNRPDFEASGNEWRTPPLWGIGLVKNVNGHTRYLHDGRARNLEEAILWHGGEAEKSQKAFLTLSKTERENVLKFLNSL